MHRWFLLLALGACATTDDPGTDSDSDSDADTDTDAADTDTAVVDGEVCEALWGATFASVEEGECGLGPDGVVLCTWHVSFTATTWSWQHSDFGASGTYTCADGAITAEGGGGPYTGTYDPASDQLTWDGVLYERAPR